MQRTLLVLLLLGCSSTALAQAPARAPRTLSGGVCGTTNWVCVSECIDSACVDHCLREGCEQALARLRVCTDKAGCAPEDTKCSARMCGATCQRAFEPAPRSPEKEKPEPCEGLQAEGGGKALEKLVGRWELSAATLTAEPKEGPTTLEPHPRYDFARTLQVTPQGCFQMSTQLQEATLGRGSELEVRAWGSLAVTQDDKVALNTKDGQAVGQVCGKPRVVPLAKGKFLSPRYSFTLEKDTLTLMVEDASQHTFQFQRVKAQEEKVPDKP